MISPLPEDTNTQGLIELPEEVAKDSASEIGLGGPTSVVPAEPVVDQR